MIGDGQVMGGIIGKRKIAFDLWGARPATTRPPERPPVSLLLDVPRYSWIRVGENVTLANEIEATGVAGRIHLSERTYMKAKDCGFDFTPRGEIEIPGHGIHRTYLLDVPEQYGVKDIGPGPGQAHGNV